MSIGPRPWCYLVLAMYVCIHVQTVHGATVRGEDLLQFVSQGHSLGFRGASVVVASSDHALMVQHMGAREVAPVAESLALTVAAPQPFRRVTYPDAWDGVTIVYESAQGGILKSSYLIESRATRRAVEGIQLCYNRSVRLNAAGELEIAFESGIMVESAPSAWQAAGRERREVSVAYRLTDSGEVGFSIGAFDESLPLIIDPLLTWNTFLGGSGEDYGYAMAIDGSGNVYVAGTSNATWGSPIRAYSALNDTFVAKLDGAGSMVWNTFLGGSGGDGCNGIATDSSGNVYVTGMSSSTWGSPLRSYSSGLDAFVARLDSSGGLTWNTFLGGSGADVGACIAVDATGSPFITGQSNVSWGSSIRAHTPGSYDALVAKLGSDGTLLWHTFLGASGGDWGTGLAVDGAGNAYVAGTSSASWGSPILPYSYADAFAAKIAADGSLSWNTFLGGTGTDAAYGVAVDGSGSAFIVGQSTATWGSPQRPYTSLDDAFVVKLASDGSLAWITFLGGSATDHGHVVAVHSGGGITVAGYSTGTWGSPARPYTASTYDGFAARLAGDGSLIWNTFLGGTGDDRGYGVVVDGGGSTCVAGPSTETWGSPIRGFGSGHDVFVTKIPETPTLVQFGTLTAMGTEHGVRVEWKTLSERDTAGFNVWRDDGNGDYQQLNPSMIPNRGSDMSGATYAYDDDHVTAGATCCYALEEVDGEGAGRMHGPVCALAGCYVSALAPTDGSRVSRRKAPEFSWRAWPADRFVLQFSTGPGFDGRTLSFPRRGEFLSGTAFMPSRDQWDRALSLCARRHGGLYWRVLGVDASGSRTSSASSELRIGR